MKALDVRTRVQLKNILFTTDFSPAADAAIPYAAELAKHYRAKLHALHVRPPVINPTTPPESWKGLEEAAGIEAEQQTQKLFKSFVGIRPEVLILEGDLWSNLAALGPNRWPGVAKFSGPACCWLSTHFLRSSTCHLCSRESNHLAQQMVW
jgi:hypothetical protein